MKIIHCADLHLDSKIESNLTLQKSRERKKEIIMAFCRMVDYARDNGVTAVIIAGDLFDTNRMLAATRSIILDKIAEQKDIDFLYLCGNHDAGKTLTEFDLPENLKLFSDKWQSYTYGNVNISGVELTEENCRYIYGSLSLPKDKFNIVTMHGEIGTASGVDAVNRTELSDKGINYLALGHYHKYTVGELGKSGVWAYSGCLEGRGFDECGDKGFILLDINDDGSFKYIFVKNSMRDIVERQCDISKAFDFADILKKIEAELSDVKPEAMVKVVLTGGLPIDAVKDIEYFKKHLSERFWFVKIKDKTHIELKYEDYVNDISLKGEFIRAAFAAGLPDEMRDRVIECGLAALSGQEVQ